uniref:Uncharacterized protein n=1 Tax=Zea mays TaxID=4577 RepID=A0A804M8F7_MAIZE
MASCLSCSCRRFTTPDCTLLPSASAFATSPTSPSVWSCPRLPSPQSVDKAEASGRRQVEGAPIASASRAGSPHRTPTPDTIPFRRRIDFSSSEPAAGADGDPFQPDLDRPTPTPALFGKINKTALQLSARKKWEGFHGSYPYLPRGTRCEKKGVDRTANAVLDIEGLPQPPDKCCSGSPKMIRALSRKGSNRMEMKGGDELEQQEDLTRKLIIKVVPSQLEQQRAMGHCTPCAPVLLIDSAEGRSSRRFGRLITPVNNPRRILLFFATLSSVGTTILIYFTLAINSRAEA